MFDNSNWAEFNEAHSIWEKIGKENDGSTYIRKAFNLDKKVEAATLYICGLGFEVTKINGKRVTENVLTTHFTAYDKRILYNEYDVTSLLKKGKNAICSELGNGWRNPKGKTWGFDTAPWWGGRQLIAQINITFDDGTKEVIGTDASWKCKSGPTIYNHLREGETYDARLAIEEVYHPDFDDSTWDNAEIWNGPGGIFEKTDCPPVRELRVLKGEYIGNGIYDFGENISGYARISLKAPKERGRKVTLIYSEQFKSGDIDCENMNLFCDDMGHQDTYIIAGKDKEVWNPSFVYHGFRYVKVENAPESFKIEAVEVHTDLESVGSFECSSEMLNKIHNATRLSTVGNFLSIPTDCPHREQNGWTGDASLSADQAQMNFDMKEAYRKWLLDIKDAQKPDGQIPGIIPSAPYSSGFGPAWDSVLFMIPYSYYHITGSTEFIELMWENMKRYMGFIKHRSVNYIADFGLGDWCAPRNTRMVLPSKITSTAYFYRFAKIMAEFAEMMGEEREPYEALAENVRNAYRENFLNNKSFGKSQTFYACGLYQGMYNDDEIPIVAEKLARLVKEENHTHFDCGILGIKYIFTALSENGYGNIVYRAVTHPDFPGYGFWVNSGMTTLCEDWDMKTSLNHHMFSEVDFWFYKYLGGIRIENGDITIKPLFLDSIKWVKAEHKGIKVYWNEEEVRITLPKRGKIEIGDISEERDAGEYIYKR